MRRRCRLCNRWRGRLPSRGGGCGGLCVLLRARSSSSPDCLNVCESCQRIWPWRVGGRQRREEGHGAEAGGKGNELVA